MVAAPNQPTQSDSRYRQMWMHERNRRIEVEQENIRLRKIVYNAKFSINERAIALEVVEQVKEARHVDEQGRKLFSQKDAAEKLGLSRGTISTAVDVLTQSGFIKDKETSTLRDKEGKIVKGKDGRPITTIHLDIDQDMLEDFSQAERADPRKIKDNRKQPVFQCQKCLTEDVTIETSRHLVCRNPNCKACGERVLIDVDYKDQHSEEPAEKQTEESAYSAQILDTIKLLDNSAQILDTIQTEDESNKTHTTSSAALDSDSIIKDWLNIRRGSNHIITATGKIEDPRGKYIYQKEEYQPDLDKYIAGDTAHIYGSRLLNPETGLTQVLCFEIDKPEHDAQAQNYLIDLARAGAAPVYWMRYVNDRNRGHLELYFDQPVDPDVARKWAIEVCPDLEEIPEVFPCQAPQDKRKQALSWPLWMRIDSVVGMDNAVFTCEGAAMLPAPHDGNLRVVESTDKEGLSELITLAVTPAALVEEFATVLSEQERASADGVFIGISPKPYTQVQSDRDLKSQVIAEQCARYSWDDIAAMCGGYDKGFFKAVWRGERTASVRPDKNSVYACDYGNHGMFPKKMDTYGAYCLIHDIDQKADIAERCAELRRAEIKIVESVEPAAELFPPEQQQKPVYYTPCIVCGKPKSVLRADGVSICGTQH